MAARWYVRGTDGVWHVSIPHHRERPYCGAPLRAPVMGTNMTPKPAMICAGCAAALITLAALGPKEAQ